MSFTHKKSLGQHFLNSDYVPRIMGDAGRVAAGDTVLEIGPGVGALTRELLTRGAKVVAVEADERAIATMADDFADAIAREDLRLEHADARTLDCADLGLSDKQFKIIANIPYYLSGLLFRRCLESTCQPTDLVFLIQKEVAERIARSEKTSIIHHSVKVFGEPTYICTVGRNHFTPPPTVDSAVLAVQGISRRNFAESKIAPADFFHLLHIAFGQKRKQLQTNLNQSKQWDSTLVANALTAANIKSTARAEDCQTDQLLALTKILYPNSLT